MSAPLNGVRVLDLCRVLAGPFAGRMLSDLGADVVKVEPPEGDVTRKMGGNRPQTAYFRQQNTGKRSITIDFNTAEGCALVKQLAAVADVVLENFRPGVLARFGLGWPDLAALNPRLVMLSISGFGQDGPERDRAAYAGVIHAETGLISRQPGQDGAPHADIPISMADSVTGLHGVIAVLAALRHRDVTGAGNHIDMAMMDAMLACDDYAPGALHARGSGRHGDGDPDVPQFGNCDIVDAPGGALIVMGEMKWIWKSVHERLGVPDPTPEGADLTTKVLARRQAWRDFVAGFDDRAELLAALDRANLAWGVVKTSKEAVQSPTFAHRGTLTELTEPDGSTYSVIRAPTASPTQTPTSSVRRRARASTPRRSSPSGWGGPDRAESALSGRRGTGTARRRGRPGRRGRRRRRRRATPAGVAGRGSPCRPSPRQRVGGEGEVRVAGGAHPLPAQPAQHVGRLGLRVRQQEHVAVQRLVLAGVGTVGAGDPRQRVLVAVLGERSVERAHLPGEVVDVHRGR